MLLHGRTGAETTGHDWQQNISVTPLGLL